MGEIQSITVNTSDYLPESPEPHIEDETESNWLFSSARDYIKQIVAYKKFKLNTLE
jgi:hypothetical protein